MVYSQFTYLLFNEQFIEIDMQLQIIGFLHCLIWILILKSDVSFLNNSVGYVCVLLLRVILPVESASNCEISADGLVANCTGKVKIIPDDLGSKITTLDLSSNMFIELRENHLKKYAQLIKLMLKYIKIDISRVDLFLFRPLKKLKVLDLSQSDFTERAYFYFPESLTVLNMNYLRVKDADLSQLKNLREFHAKTNQFLELPIIHELAPLTIIDLDSNILAILTPERLAPFCKLETLNVNLDPNARLISSPSRYCVCARVNLWMHSFNILGEKLSCNPLHFQIKCDETFSDETLSVYNNCLERYKKHSNLKIFIITAICAILLVAASGLGYLGYWYYNTKMKSSHSDHTAPMNDSIARRESSRTEMEDTEY